MWRIDPPLVLALDERLGVPVDSYLNGAQTWLVDNGPGGATIEWRLHPAPGYSVPRGASHYDIWETVVGELQTGVDPEHLVIGEETRALASMWEGLEAFPAYDDDPEPAALSDAMTMALGLAPAAAGLVDHDAIADAWERTRGRTSIVDALLEQLAG